MENQGTMQLELKLEENEQHFKEAESLIKEIQEDFKLESSL